MSTNTDSCDKELLRSATHLPDLSFDDLLHVLVSLRLEQVLPVSVPGTPPSLVILLEDDWRLHKDYIHELIKAKEFI